MSKAPVGGHAVDSDLGEVVPFGLAGGDGHLGIGVGVSDHMLTDLTFEEHRLLSPHERVEVGRVPVR